MGRSEGGKRGRRRKTFYGLIFGLGESGRSGESAVHRYLLRRKLVKRTETMNASDLIYFIGKFSDMLPPTTTMVVAMPGIGIELGKKIERKSDSTKTVHGKGASNMSLLILPYFIIEFKLETGNGKIAYLLI